MATAPASRAPAVTLDASVVIGYCAKEPTKYSKAKAELERYSNDGWDFGAPGVLLSEALYVLCGKLLNNELSVAEHLLAVKNLEQLMLAVKGPPTGEAALVARAEKIRANYGCSRSADSIYLALAEELTGLGPAEIVTFDGSMANQAAANAPTVRVKHLSIP
jgi:predicted nucleic acid-binding protein